MKDGFINQTVKSSIRKTNKNTTVIFEFVCLFIRLEMHPFPLMDD